MAEVSSVIELPIWVIARAADTTTSSSPNNPPSHLSYSLSAYTHLLSQTKPFATTLAVTHRRTPSRRIHKPHPAAVMPSAPNSFATFLIIGREQSSCLYSPNPTNFMSSGMLLPWDSLYTASIRLQCSVDGAARPGTILPTPREAYPLSPRLSPFDLTNPAHCNRHRHPRIRHQIVQAQ